MTERMALYRESDFFALRDRWAGIPADTPELRFLRAALLQAFNQPGHALAATDDAMSAGGLPGDMRLELEEIRLSSWMRLFRYAEAERTAQRILDGYPSAPAEERDAVDNVRRLLAALRDVGPQRVERRGPTRVPLRDGRVPVTVGGSDRSYVLDTGANLSTLMRSEAAALGLRVRPAGFTVRTSTDLAVTGDLAVADRIAIGGLEYRNVVFLVLDDDLLTFADGVRIPGLIGFPVIEQMAEIRVVAGHALEVPEQPPRRTAANLALRGLELLTRVEWEGRTLVCRLDTGADRTQLYEPFFRRHRARVESGGRLEPVISTGAGGPRRLDAYRMDGLRLTVGGAHVTLDATHVLTQPITRGPDGDALAGNVGRDVLDAFGEYVLNFRDMAFLLTPNAVSPPAEG
jgi:hypothetical protein